MFTGLVQKLATVKSLMSRPGGARLALDLGDLAADAAYGDSVSINGTCLTVAEKHGAVCEFDAVSETLSRTTLGSLRPGDRVNVELSLRVGDRLGGHFVLGHVDGMGRIAAITPKADTAELRVSVEPELTREMVAKGSVAIDGISLTLVEVGRADFTCAIIPTTLKETTLGLRKPGDTVNIETDVLVKSVAKILGKGGPSGVTLDKLREAGFA